LVNQLVVYHLTRRNSNHHPLECFVDDNGDVNKFVLFSKTFFYLALGIILIQLGFAMFAKKERSISDEFKRFFGEGSKNNKAFLAIEFFLGISIFVMSIIAIVYAVGATENYADPDKGMNMKSVSNTAAGRGGDDKVEISTGTCFKHVDSWWAWNVAIQNHKSSLDDAPLGAMGFFAIAISTAVLSAISYITYAVALYREKGGSTTAETAMAEVAASVEAVAVKSVYSTTTTNGLKF